MGNTILPFDELMKAVLEQLKSQKYMDSTLTVYRRTYKRIHIFLNHHGTDIYTHELGKAFPKNIKSGLPSIEELEDKLSQELQDNEDTI